MKFAAEILIFLALAACASTPSTSQPGATPAPTTAGTSPAAHSLKTITHADLQAAAAYATAHGYPARAAMWTAIEAQLTAAENQIQACKDAIKAALPSGQTAPAGVFTAVEMGAEAVGQGFPASVTINCTPIPIPVSLLPVPKLP